MLTIKVATDSELSQRAQDALAAGVPLYIDNGERIFEFDVREATAAERDDIWANYDSQRVLDAFEEAAGVFDGIDVDVLLADLREQREQDSSGRPR